MSSTLLTLRGMRAEEASINLTVIKTGPTIKVDLIEREGTKMAKFLITHKIDPRIGKTDAYPNIIKGVLAASTVDTYCITSWVAGGAGKIACLWEAPSEQAIIDIFAANGPDLPVEGIYPATIIDWAEMKKAAG